MSMRNCLRASLVAGLALLASCAAPGSLGDRLGLPTTGEPAGSQQGQLLVEIQGVDPGSQAIHVRTEDGRTGAVRYDGNTVVVYRGEQYPVTALERGDIATLHLREISGGELYAERVDVEQSVQERQGSGE